MPCSNPVSGGRSRSDSEILPSSVSPPVRATKSLAVPLTTLDPRKRQFVRRPSGVSGGRAPADFSTGKVSPVRVASATNRSVSSRTRPSPGMMSPAFRSTTSPRTTCSTGTSRGWPSRRTVALIWTRASSFSRASAARHSCQKPSKPLPRTMARMMRASLASPRKSDRTAAKRRIRTMGLLNWARSRETMFVPRPAVRRRGGPPVTLCRASSTDKPWGVDRRSRRRSSGDTDQKSARPRAGSTLAYILRVSDRPWPGTTSRRRDTSWHNPSSPTPRICRTRPHTPCTPRRRRRRSMPSADYRWP